MKHQFAWLALGVVLLPAAAHAQVTQACRVELNAVDDSFGETLKRLDRVAKGTAAEKCAAVDHHITVMITGRDVYLRCLPAGHDRGENVAQLNASIVDFLDIRKNLRCGGAPPVPQSNPPR